MSTYELEKVSAFETKIGQDCYAQEQELICEVEESSEEEISDLEFYERLSQILPVDLAQKLVKKLNSCSGTVSPSRSCFIPEEHKLFWQSLNNRSFVVHGGEPVRFSPPEEMHMLYNSYLQATFPRLSLKSGQDVYRISWSKYCCFNLINKAEIKPKNGTTICSLDKYGLEFMHMFMRVDSHTKQLEYDTGTDKTMNRWATTLPEQKRCCPLYWFYSIDPSNAFPLYKLGEKPIEHCFSFNKQIANHLRMQKFVDGRWEWMKPDLSLLEGLPTDNKLADPVLYGQFTTNTPCEKTHVYNDINVSYIDDMLCLDSTNPKSFGETFEVTLKTNGKLCRALFGAVENTTSSTWNNNFNFTDNPDDSELGESPIEYILIYYNDASTPKIGPYDMSHFKSAVIVKHVKSSETNNGHFAIPFDFETWKVGSGSGIVPDKLEAKLVCKLRDKRPTDNDCKFNLILRLRVSKKLTIDSVKNSLLCQ